MSRLSITIVTPWKNHREELERAYFSAIRVVDAELLIVDDGSDPPLPNGIRPRQPGFAGACNAGLYTARTDAVLFLNNDIVAHAKDWIEPIRDALEDGVLVGGNLVNSPHGRVDGEPMPYLDGWCLAGMTDDLLELEGFDETFDEPSYYGDNDLCFRARLAGMRLREARVQLEHLRNRTIGVPDQRVRDVTLRNKARFEARVREALIPSGGVS
jgi:GT2 family glycosyltransferase